MDIDSNTKFLWLTIPSFDVKRYKLLNPEPEKWLDQAAAKYTAAENHSYLENYYRSAFFWTGEQSRGLPSTECATHPASNDILQLQVSHSTSRTVAWSTNSPDVADPEWFSCNVQHKSIWVTSAALRSFYARIETIAHSDRCVQQWNSLGCTVRQHPSRAKWQMMINFLFSLFDRSVAECQIDTPRQTAPEDLLNRGHTSGVIAD